MEDTVTLRELLLRALAVRREAAARYRELATSAPVRAEPAVARVFARLSVIEAEHANKIERAMPELDGGARLPRALEWRPFPGARGNGGVPAPAGLDAALDEALYNERQMRAIFEHIAASASSDAVRMRALEFALAESRHLALIEEAVAQARRRAPPPVHTTGRRA